MEREVKILFALALVLVAVSIVITPALNANASFNPDELEQGIQAKINNFLDKFNAPNLKQEWMPIIPIISKINLYLEVLNPLWKSLLATEYSLSWYFFLTLFLWIFVLVMSYINLRRAINKPAIMTFLICFLFDIIIAHAKVYYILLGLMEKQWHENWKVIIALLGLAALLVLIVEWGKKASRKKALEKLQEQAAADSERAAENTEEIKDELREQRLLPAPEKRKEIEDKTKKYLQIEDKRKKPLLLGWDGQKKEGFIKRLFGKKVIEIPKEDVEVLTNETEKYPQIKYEPVEEIEESELIEDQTSKNLELPAPEERLQIEDKTSKPLQIEYKPTETPEEQAIKKALEKLNQSTYEDTKLLEYSKTPLLEAPPEEPEKVETYIWQDRRRIAKGDTLKYLNHLSDTKSDKIKLKTVHGQKNKEVAKVKGVEFYKDSREIWLMLPITRG